MEENEIGDTGKEEELRRKLFRFIREFAFLRGEFRLASGQISNYYVDIKRICLFGEFLDSFSELIYHIVKREFETRDFAGVELGAVPLVASAVMKMWQKGEKSEGVIIRKKPKEHGTGKWIEGGNPKEVILLEDVITTGGTTMQAIEKLKEHNIKVVGIITLVDRGGAGKVKEEITRENETENQKKGEKNKEEEKNKKVKVISIFHISEFLSD